MAASISRLAAVGQSTCASGSAEDHAPEHFLTKLVFAAPDSFFPSLPTALSSQHFFMKDVFAAPASSGSEKEDSP
jgi:hypothetical protein